MNNICLTHLRRAQGGQPYIYIYKHSKICVFPPSAQEEKGTTLYKAGRHQQASSLNANGTQDALRVPQLQIDGQLLPEQRHLQLGIAPARAPVPHQ